MGNPQQTRKIWVKVYLQSGFRLWIRTRLIIRQINSREDPKTRAEAHSVKPHPRLFDQSTLLVVDLMTFLAPQVAFLWI